MPFGALVNLMGNEGRSAIVDEAGQVYLTGMPPQGTLDVAWGQENSQRCQVDYSLAADNSISGISMAQFTCR